MLLPQGDEPAELVHTYHAGNGQHPSFGELSLMYGKPRAATIVARTSGKRRPSIPSLTERLSLAGWGQQCGVRQYYCFVLRPSFFQSFSLAVQLPLCVGVLIALPLGYSLRQGLYTSLTARRLKPL